MKNDHVTVTPDLVERARAGDIVACGELVVATEGLVRAAIRTVTRDAGLVDDAAQDTYLRAFAALRSLRDPVAFPAWLGRIAVSTARNEVRRRRGVAVDPLLLDTRPARSAVPADEPLHAALRRAIVRLPAAERRLCDRYYRGAWTTRRLAQSDGVPEATVRKRLQRMRERLGKEIAMTLESHDGYSDDLSDRIVELLARPLLLDLPENPIGAVWDRLVELRDGDEIVDLPEELADADVAALFGEDAASALPETIHRIDDGRFLRFDQTLPMLIAARGRASGARLLAAGKVYRADDEDHAHLQAFHQAELLWTGENLSTWGAMEVVTSVLDDLLPGARLRVEEVDYPLYADRGYEVLVQHGDHWVGVAGWARFADRVVTKLGLDSSRDVALGLGLGLERIACLRYGIDDVRRVAGTRIEE